MNKPLHSDQAHIAEECMYLEDHICQTSRLAHFKINSYKLSLINAAFCMTREELTGIIKNTLLNYTAPSTILSKVGFFEAESSN